MAAFLLFLLILGAVAVSVWFGYMVAKEEYSDDRDELDVQRQVLDAEWIALENSRKVNDVFFHARDALRRAERDDRSSGRWRL